MTKQITLFLAVLLLTATWAWCADPMQIDEGEYEFTVQTEMTGMAMKMPPTTFKQCINKNDPVPQNTQPNQQCVIKDLKYSGNTATWTTVCNSPQGEMTGQGKATYKKDSLEGSMTMNVQGMTIVNNYKGHRIGPCK